MQHVKMNLWWISMALLRLGLSHAKDTQSAHARSDQQRTVCVATGDSVSVHCPNITSEEVTFRLLMGQQEIGSHRFKHADNSTLSAERTVRIKKDLELYVNRTDWSATFVLSGVTTECVGFYSCEVTVEYPPPLTTSRSPSGVLVLVEGHQCKLRNGCNSTVGGRDQYPAWIWCLGLGAVSTYGLVVTIIAMVIWLRLRRTESSQSDYMNTKPMMPRGHRKKKGFQHPVPRHF